MLWMSVAPAPAEARNAQHTKFLQLVKRAEVLYQGAHYPEAAAMLQQAYEVEANPRVLYNIARAFDQSGSLKPALDYYQKYLASERTDAMLAQRASLSVDRLKGLIDKQEAEAKKQEEERARSEAKAKAAEEHAQSEADAARRAEAEATLQTQARQRAQLDSELASRRRMRIASFTVGGLGVAAVGVGAAFGVLANSSHTQFTQADSAADKDSFASTTRSRALIADVGYGAGVLALGAAFFLYPKGKAPGPVTLVPVPGGVGLAVGF
jgi:tetratricopeptide (TPR) repeat protein